MGDEMDGGRNGCFWGAPILHLFVERPAAFSKGFGQKSGHPKNGRSYPHPIPHLTSCLLKNSMLNPFEIGVGQFLSGSHRSTHIASDLEWQMLASQAKPQRKSESQPFRIAQS